MILYDIHVTKHQLANELIHNYGNKTDRSATDKPAATRHGGRETRTVIVTAKKLCLWAEFRRTSEPIGSYCFLSLFAGDDHG